MRNGDYITYHENGQVLTKRQYKDGKLHGEYIVYYSNGQIKEKAQYIDDVLQ